MPRPFSTRSVDSAAQQVLLDKMAETVTATGTLVKKGGTQLLYVKSVK